MKTINVLNDCVRFINNHNGDCTVEGIVDSIDNWFQELDVEPLTSYEHLAYTELNNVLYSYYKSLFD